MQRGRSGSRSARFFHAENAEWRVLRFDLVKLKIGMLSVEDKPVLGKG